MVLKSFTALNRLDGYFPAFLEKPLLPCKFNTYDNLARYADVGTTQERAPECGVILGTTQEFTQNIRLENWRRLPSCSCVSLQGGVR
jgi:hypothetical protein